MIEYKSGQVSKKEKEQINSILDDIVDIYSDFYITKDRIRLFIRENKHLLFEALTKGDKLIFGEEGIIFITGFSDNSERKYVKILTRDNKDAQKLLKMMNWNLNNIELYAKIKKDNFLVNSLQSSGFEFKGDRGREILLCKKAKNNIEENARSQKEK